MNIIPAYPRLYDTPYNIIYADPPWFYNQRANLNTRFRGGARGYYKVMRTEEICALPVPEISAPDSYLFLWATWPNIQEAFKVMKAWGFRYATCAFMWVKTNPKDGKPFFGPGFYTAANSEPCLLGVKGRPWAKVWPKDVREWRSRLVSQVVISPRGEHSRKPDNVRNLIIARFGHLPRIELFAVEKAPGWDAWGDALQNPHPKRPVRVG